MLRLESNSKAKGYIFSGMDQEGHDYKDATGLNLVDND